MAVFLAACAQFYLPGRGFTYLVLFGGNRHSRLLPELRAVNHYEASSSDGYDGQFYAQLAMRPDVGDPAVRAAVDNPAYRGRRILFSALAYALGGGDPIRALNIYALENVAAWFCLAFLLLRWLPPSSWENVGRWAAILFSLGLCSSVRRALLDGPSLLLVTCAMALIGSRRSTSAAGLLGLAALGRETNALAVLALPWPAKTDGARGRWLWTLRWMMVILPIAAWVIALRIWLGPGQPAGARNFDWPLVGYARNVIQTLQQLAAEGFTSVAPRNLFVIVALTTQFLYFALRPRWREAWWRLGASYAGLMVFLGDAVWEGYPGAVSRVVLPMTLAFNIDAGRGKRRTAAWALLIAGNLSLICSWHALVPPDQDAARVEGPRGLRIHEPSGEVVDVQYDPGSWFSPESSLLDYWRWSRGPAKITFHNPQPYAIEARVTFAAKGLDDRTLTVRSAQGAVLWRGGITPKLRPGEIPEFSLPPGDTEWDFITDRPPTLRPGNRRKVAFSLRSFKLVLLKPARPAGSAQ